jgi:hypothetical protein
MPNKPPTDPPTNAELYEWLKEIEYAEHNDSALELDPYLAELRVLRIRRKAMAARNRASQSAAEGPRGVLLEMAEAYERIAESAEQRRQAPGPQR